MNPITVTVGPLDAADADGICLAQTAAGAGALDLDGVLVDGDGVAILDVPRRVAVTSSGDDTGITFQITGTNGDGNPIRQTKAGANADVMYTDIDFQTVLDITVSGATDGDVTVGTNGIASSRWITTNYAVPAGNISVAVIVSGTVNYTIEYTYESPNSNMSAGMASGPLGNYPAVPNYFSHATLGSLTSSDDGFFNDPVFAVRLTLNSQTNPGYATATFLQAGVRSS